MHTFGKYEYLWTGGALYRTTETLGPWWRAEGASEEVLDGPPSYRSSKLEAHPDVPTWVECDCPLEPHEPD